MENSSFNLRHVAAVLKKKWSGILIFTLCSGVVAAITVLIVPPYFRSTAIVVAANPELADKARFFNHNIRELYSYYGTGDDLDRIYGIADMDLTYGKLVDEFSLVSYYKLSGDKPGVLKQKAVVSLRKDISLQKTEEKQLRITAWTKDRQLSSNLVNRMVIIMEEIATSVWQKNYQSAVAKLNASVSSMEDEYAKLSDSLQFTHGAKLQLATAQLQTLAEEITQYHKTSNEYKLASQAPPPALYVMEAASASARAERPDKPFIILTACLLGFIFSSLVVLVNNRNTMA